MRRQARNFACLAFVWAVGCAVPPGSNTRARGISSAAQGILTRVGAVVLYGSSTNTTKPATIDYKDVEQRTPEYQTIRSEGVRKGSARYDLLVSGMKVRIKMAAVLAARAGGIDCVVRKGDIKDAQGLEVMDLTDRVIAELEARGPTP